MLRSSEHQQGNQSIFWCWYVCLHHEASADTPSTFYSISIHTNLAANVHMNTPNEFTLLAASHNFYIFPQWQPHIPDILLSLINVVWLGFRVSCIMLTFIWYTVSQRSKLILQERSYRCAWYKTRALERSNSYCPSCVAILFAADFTAFQVWFLEFP